MIRQAYPNAMILPHPTLGAEEAEELCRNYGLRLSSTLRGVAHFEPGKQGTRPAPAPTEPEAA